MATVVPPLSQITKPGSTPPLSGKPLRPLTYKTHSFHLPQTIPHLNTPTLFLKAIVFLVNKKQHTRLTQTPFLSSSISPEEAANMRMSCNGCRVLRKGCSENCSIRPCLQWIKNPEAQANATVFLAKFYGRAGLMNLINAGPDHLRPAIFRSLLYEACGRIVNPIYGSVGLLWSGSWQLCQTAVEAVLKGAPIVQIPTEAAVSPSPSPPMKAYDIRHVSKDENSAASQDLHKVKSRGRFKRSAIKPKAKIGSASAMIPEPAVADPPAATTAKWQRCFHDDDFNRASSHDHESSGSHSHQTELNGEGDRDSRETESMFSVETVEPSLVSQADTKSDSQTDESEVELELTLGFEPVHRTDTIPVGPIKGRGDIKGSGCDTCKMELSLDYPA